MKGITGFLLGIIATVVVMAVAVLTFGPSMMIHEHLSPMGLDDTVNKIVENAVHHIGLRKGRRQYLHRAHECRADGTSLRWSDC